MDSSISSWTLKKAVTTLAIAPQTESLTRAGRMAYNLMIFIAQRSPCDGDGGYSAPLSQIVKGFGATTRDSSRIRLYIEQMCSTVVRWFPLSSSDEHQISIDGLEDPPLDPTEDGRIFSLLSEARFSRRSGEQWVTWFFPPTIRDMLIEPMRWAQLDIKELSLLSHYASVALYEICARYKDVPGGLTNRAEPSFWVQTLRPDPETKPREWRKFKNETLKPAVAEISKRTSLDVRLIEYKQGRAIVSVQFAVKRKATEKEISSVDLGLVEQAAALEIKERDLDQLVDQYGEELVGKAIQAMLGRQRAQPTVPIKFPLAYIRKSLRNGLGGLDLEQPEAEVTKEPSVPLNAPERQASEEWLAHRKRELNDALDNLDTQQLEHYVELATAAMASAGILSPAMRKRLDNKQYRAPMVWEYIRSAYATVHYGGDWKNPENQVKTA